MLFDEKTSRVEALFTRKRDPNDTVWVPPAWREVLGAGAVLTLIAVVMILVSLDILLYGKGFTNDSGPYLASLFLLAFGVLVLALVIVSLFRIVVKNHQVRVNATPNDAESTP